MQYTLWKKGYTLVRQLPSQIKLNQPYAPLWHWRGKELSNVKTRIKSKWYLIVYLQRNHHIYNESYLTSRSYGAPSSNKLPQFFKKMKIFHFRISGFIPTCSKANFICKQSLVIQSLMKTKILNEMTVNHIFFPCEIWWFAYYRMSKVYQQHDNLHS